MESSLNEKGSGSVGSISKGKEFANFVDLDSDEFSPSNTDIDDEQVVEQTSLQELGEDFLNKFCKEASRSFFEEFGLISHQLNSYNDFISNLSKIFKSFGEFIVEPGFDPSKKEEEDDWRYASIKFGEITLDRPSFWGGLEREKEYNMLPRHARLQNLTYSAKLKGIVRVEVFTKRRLNSDKFKTGKEHYIEKKVISTVEKEVTMGKLPVMVKSDLCWMKELVEKEDCEFDLGGYFLIKGAEKVFIAQEQICKNRLWLSHYEDLTVTYQSEAGRRNRLSIKLVPLLDRKSKGEGKILTVDFLSAEIPLWVLFFAIGVSSDKEVVDLIDFNSQDARVTNIIFNSIHYADKKCSGLYATKLALRYIEKMIKEETKFPPEESVEECLRIYLFPDMKGLKRKARFLGYMVKCLFEAFTGRRKYTHKEDFKNKRIEMAGELLERELRSHIAHARKRMTKALQRDLYSAKGLKAIEYYFDASIITNGLSRAFSTGTWCHPYKRTERISGVVATLGRTNPLQTMIELRRTRQQVNYSGKVGDSRFPHPSHWGKVCFLSTPDGENCGLVKNMAAAGLLSTTGPEPEYLISKLKRCGMEILADDTKTPVFGKVKVFLNGAWVGMCDDSLTFVAKLRKFRRNKRLPCQIEIKRDDHHGEVRIFSDAGRILRPLLVVENLGKLNPSNGDNYNFRSLLHKGILELIGTEEEEDCSTAWGIKFLFMDNKAKYTHCELDLSFLLGINAGIVPFANHDHAKRVLYQSQKHCQQAIGFSSTNPNIRVDTLSHQLHYPQRPLFRTMTSDCLGKQGHVLSYKGFISKSQYYNGQNAIVAVNVHMGYNQEDSLVMNRASLDRGMFRSEHIRSYKADVDNKESSDKRQKPEDSTHFGKIASRIGRTDNLDEDGFPPVGASLQTGDIIIGRGADSGADHSVKLKHTEKGMVQKVVLSSNDEGKNFAVVSLRQVRTPTLGDKFSSMHGQKGVVGYLECQENFCFTKQGIVPDIVINPHAFPSRQTPGQLLEAALGKGIAMAGNGVVKDATPFSTPSCDAITDQLHRAGFTRWGNERMYDGRTGEFLKSLIFMGPTFYQRLIHMAEDKVKFRNTGPVHPMTRQPVADRKRYGGVKFGEMERDCLLAHGASANLYERLFTLSDSSEMYICQHCNNIANVIQRAVTGAGINRIRGPYCRICKSGDHIVRVQVPHGAKLLSQELFAMGINLKFQTKIC